MIESVKIQNFKFFNSLELQGLSQVSLIGGKNNTGKSSLLEAIFLFYDRSNPNFILQTSGWKGVNTVPLKPEYVWGPAFPQYDLNKTISIEIIENKISQCLNISYLKDRKYTPIENHPKISPMIKSDETVIEHSLQLQILNNQKEEYKLFTLLSNKGLFTGGNIPEPKLSKQVAYLSDSTINIKDDIQRFGEMDVTGHVPKLIPFLNIIEPALKSLSILPMTDSVNLIIGDIGQSRKIPVNYMGNGLRKLLSILLAVWSFKNGIILIDEIENGFHRSILPKIWECLFQAAKEFNCQIIATTHSHECLESANSAAKKTDFPGFNYIRLDRNADQSVAKIYSIDVLDAAFKNGWEVR